MQNSITFSFSDWRDNALTFFCTPTPVPSTSTPSPRRPSPANFFAFGWWALHNVHRREPTPLTPLTEDMSDSRYAVLPLTVWTSNFARVRGPTPRELATFDNYSTLNVQDEKAKGIEEQAMSTVIVSINVMVLYTFLEAHVASTPSVLHWRTSPKSLEEQSKSSPTRLTRRIAPRA